MNELIIQGWHQRSNPKAAVRVLLPHVHALLLHALLVLLLLRGCGCGCAHGCGDDDDAHHCRPSLPDLRRYRPSCLFRRCLPNHLRCFLEYRIFISSVTVIAN
ncbi:hypothetical protein PMAYCL1PPCAC_16709 [Pristionchus mayeri]|uniref:Uncharacterized protein n=1 Tax=Pristionchus mayeri TaxID=1317129 RepID=A0AAN5HZJ7_9BILA|nr:hypothetical protein PMAYCL1PPCAC_16709 [Pristionchus mayeri]